MIFHCCTFPSPTISLSEIQQKSQTGSYSGKNVSCHAEALFTHNIVLQRPKNKWLCKINSLLSQYQPKIVEDFYRMNFFKMNFHTIYIISKIWAAKWLYGYWQCKTTKPSHLHVRNKTFLKGKWTFLIQTKYWAFHWRTTKRTILQMHEQLSTPKPL